VIARGRIKGGVVVFEQSVRLHEGEEVAVIAIGESQLRHGTYHGDHSFGDIPPVDLGAMLKPFTADDDLLGEMLEDRR